jgi:hypothetical protein
MAVGVCLAVLAPLAASCSRTASADAPGTVSVVASFYPLPRPPRGSAVTTSG